MKNTSTPVVVRDASWYQMTWVGTEVCMNQGWCIRFHYLIWWVRLHL